MKQSSAVTSVPTDCRNFVAIVTGGAKGIGLEVTRRLVRNGVHVIIGSRDRKRAKEAIEEMKELNPDSKVEFIPLDLKLFNSIKEFVQAFTKKDLPLHILVNNAGVLFTPGGDTESGYIEELAVNYFGHFCLTHLLLDRIKKTGTQERFARVVNVSSAIYRVGHIDFSKNKSRYSSIYLAYPNSKLAQILFTYKLQRLMQATADNVTVVAVHPGVVGTNLYQNLQWPLISGPKLAAKLHLSKSPSEGADTVLFAAMSPTLEGRGGLYLDNCTETETSSYTMNYELQDQLWEDSLNRLMQLQQIT